MAQISEKAKKILIVLGLLTIAVVGLTLAYYSGQEEFENEFHVKEPGVAIYEKFNPTDWWVPGEEKSKQAWFTNTGEMDMLLRFKITPEWVEKPKDKNGIVLPDEKIKPIDEVITLYWKDSTGGTPIALPKASEDNPVIMPEEGSAFDFIAIYDRTEKTTYYYYKKVLKAKGSSQSSTQHVLESVKFSENLSNDGHKNSDYSNVQIDLTIAGETVLVDERAVEEQWPGVTVSFTKNSEGAVSEVNWSRAGDGE